MNISLPCSCKVGENWLCTHTYSGITRNRPAGPGVLYLFIVGGQCHTRPLMHLAGVLGCYPRPVLAFGYCRCLRPSVRQSVRPSVTKFVRAITHHPFKLGSPNLEHRCKRPWLRSLLFCGVIDLDLQGQI